MQQRYSKEQLNHISAQALFYQCACPAQIIKLLFETFELYKYQLNCLNKTDVDTRVHQNIAEATSDAYARLEQSLTDVLALEGWDLNTLEMPEALQKLTLEGGGQD